MAFGKSFCAVDGCLTAPKARGWCGKHYKRWLAHGDPLKTLRPNIPTKCSVVGCHKQAKTRSWCGTHYARWRKHGSPHVVLVDSGSWRPKRATVVERLMDQTIKSPSGCWLWTGTLNHQGYGVVSYEGRSRSTHRAGYTQLKGPIPEGLTLDHLCRVRHCWNPDHLEPVTMRENLMRGDTWTAINSAKTHCKWGHEFNEANTYNRKDRVGRECRICMSNRQRQFENRSRQSINEEMSA